MQRYNVEGPAEIETSTGLKIQIDAFNNVTIVGQNQMRFVCEGDMEFDADNIRMYAKDQFRLESGRNLIHKAARIDINPVDESNLDPNEKVDIPKIVSGCDLGSHESS